MLGVGAICLIVAVLLVVAWAVVLTWRETRAFRAQCRAAAAAAAVTPGPPVTCPACGDTDVERVSGELWQGFDPVTGARVGGTSFFGVCRRCGGRVARWNDAPCYVPSATEWATYAESRERAEAVAERARMLRGFGSKEGG